MNPVQKCHRYSARKKKKIEIDQPNVIKQYNRYMGGVDQLDNHVANYRIAFRGKKWYTPIVYWLIDLCARNAYILARQFGCNKDNLEFRRSIATAFLAKYGKKSVKPGRKKTSIEYPLLANGPHTIITQQNRLRCQICKNKTSKACKTCNVPLHDKCFSDYHSHKNVICKTFSAFFIFFKNCLIFLRIKYLNLILLFLLANEFLTPSPFF